MIPRKAARWIHGLESTGRDADTSAMDLDLTAVPDNDLLDMLACLRRDFVAADGHAAWVIWQRVAYLAAESERRLLVRDCEEYLRQSSNQKMNSESGSRRG